MLNESIKKDLRHLPISAYAQIGPFLGQWWSVAADCSRSDFASLVFAGSPRIGLSMTLTFAIARQSSGQVSSGSAACRSSFARMLVIAGRLRIGLSMTLTFAIARQSSGQVSNGDLTSGFDPLHFIKNKTDGVTPVCLILVERRGIEPLASRLRTLRSPS